MRSATAVLDDRAYYRSTSVLVAGLVDLGCSHQPHPIRRPGRFAPLIRRGFTCDVEGASGGDRCHLRECADLVVLRARLGCYIHSTALHYAGVRIAPSSATSPVVPARADTSWFSYSQHIPRGR